MAREERGPVGHATFGTGKTVTVHMGAGVSLPTCVPSVGDPTREPGVEAANWMDRMAGAGGSGQGTGRVHSDHQRAQQDMMN